MPHTEAKKVFYGILSSILLRKELLGNLDAT